MMNTLKLSHFGLTVYIHSFAAHRDLIVPFYGVVGFLCVNLTGSVKTSPESALVIICIGAKSCASTEDTLCSV